MSEAVDPDLRQRFLAGMSNAACTVNVVTTDGAGGRAGVTVSAMSSVSADTPKPTLLVCVHHLSSVADKILANGVFCVNILRDDQSYIADTFAGRFKDQITDKFDCVAWATLKTGAPRVVDPLVAFDCRLISQDRVGTHYVFIGEVVDIFIASRGSPLLYANRAYGAASRIETVGSINAGKAAENRKLSIGCFHTFGPSYIPTLIGRLAAQKVGLDINLVEGDQRRIQESLLAREVELALLYDFDLSDDLSTEFLTTVDPYVLLAEDHLLAAHDVLEPRDLADHPMILLSAPPSRGYFENIMGNAGFEPKVAFQSSSFEMVRGMVGEGLGYSILATKPASSRTYGGAKVVARPLIGDAEASRVVLARRKTTELSSGGQEFSRLCRAYFAQIEKMGDAVDGA